MTRLATAVFACLFATSAMALAAGEDSGSTNTTAPTAQSCKKGEVWNKTKKK